MFYFNGMNIILIDSEWLIYVIKIIDKIFGVMWNRYFFNVLYRERIIRYV